jgi:phospholipase C
MRLTHRRLLALCAAGALALAAPAVAAAHGHDGHDNHHGKGLRAVKRIVVIYEENHSFDNLYGRWEGVEGLRDADRAHTKQVNQAGTPYTCLLQNDVNLTTPPQPATCTDTTTATSFQRAVPDRQARAHSDDGQDVPGPRRLRSERRARPHRPARWLHA